MNKTKEAIDNHNMEYHRNYMSELRSKSKPAIKNNYIKNLRFRMTNKDVELLNTLAFETGKSRPNLISDAVNYYDKYRSNNHIKIDILKNELIKIQNKLLCEQEFKIRNLNKLIKVLENEKIHR